MPQQNHGLLCNPYQGALQHRSARPLQVLRRATDDLQRDLLVAFPNQQDQGSIFGDVLVYEPDGNGGFESTGTVLALNDSTVGAPHSFSYRMSAASDFDGDGYKDLAVIGGISYRVRMVIYRGGEEGISSSPYCILPIDHRIDNGHHPYRARLVGGWDFNQDGKEDYAIGSPFFHGEFGGIHILYGQEATDSDDCEFDIEIKSWQYGTGLGGEFEVGLIDDDSCPDLVFSEPTMHTDATRSGALQILWGSGANCAADSELSSFYYPFGYNLLGTGLASGVDLNNDGYDEVVFSHGPSTEQRSFVLDGSLLSSALRKPFVGTTLSGPFYTNPSQYYDWLSDYVLVGTMYEGNSRMKMTEDGLGSKWLAFGDYQNDETRLYRYNENTGAFGQYPHTIVGSDSNSTEWKGDLGSDIQFYGDSFLVGAPLSSFQGPAVGGVIHIPLVE